MENDNKDINCSFCQKNRNEVRHMIAGPSINGYQLYICDSCVDTCVDAMYDQESNDDGKFKLDELDYTPSVIKDYLDQFIIGQDEAKKIVGISIYNHYKRIYRDIPSDSTELDKSNLLLIGPSGSGKTLIVKSVSKLFNIPYVIADATTITEAGYVGDDVVQLLTRLIKNANGDVEEAKRGIIFIDEVDKIARKSESSTVNKDVSGEGVQQALLKLIEGAVVNVPHPDNPSDTIMFDTKDILFIASGAFVDLTRIIKENRKTSSIGIGASINGDDASKQILHDVQPEDLIKFGLIPEFVGRLPVVVVLEALTTEMLVRILKEPKNNLVAQFNKLFKIDGVELMFDDKYIENIAEQSIKRGTGARGLRSIMEKTLKDIQFELPDLAKQGLQKVLIDGAGQLKYTYKTKQKQPRKQQMKANDGKKA